MSRRADRIVVAALALCLTPAIVRAQGTPAETPNPRPPVVSDGGELRTFTVTKPSAERDNLGRLEPSLHSDDASQLSLPVARDVLHTTVGLGYVQGADWGMELGVGGAVAGIEANLDALVTRGARGLVYDHGALTLHDPHTGWRLEAGDISSNLRGAAEGLRLAWGDRRHERAVAVYGTRPGLAREPLAVAYRDELRFGPETIDGEISSDTSVFLRTVLAAGRNLTMQASYRINAPVAIRDRGLEITLGAARRIAFTAAAYQLREAGGRSTVGTLVLRVPVTSFMDLTLERAVASTADGTLTSDAIGARVSAGPMYVSHRYQYGAYESSALGPAGAMIQEQLQSTAWYGRGARLNVALQLATEWRPDGLLTAWEQLQVSSRPTPHTTLQIASAFPHINDLARLQATVRQDLGHRYSLEVEYGRLSTYQAVPIATDRPRFKVMVRRSIDVTTPAAGGDVQGRVLDQVQRPVSGARVTLGCYSTDTAADGTFAFRHVPTGEYELGLAADHLPADYAWDRRGMMAQVAPSTHVFADLFVTPLNAIHGRVYTDRNGNGRFDLGEGVAGAVVRIGDQTTATDRDGGYGFYNLWPGIFTVSLEVGRLPDNLAETGSTARMVTLDDGRPVTGVDFTVATKTRPIIWSAMTP